MKDARQLADRITGLIVRPSARTLQVKIGPSNIGDPCDRCLGLAMSARLPDGPAQPPDRFNLMAWVGTAVHEKLERDIRAEGWPKIKQEFRVDIGKVGSYGRVSGSTDLYSQPERTALDFKVRGKAKITAWQRGTPIPVGTRRQGHLYGYGLERAGFPVEEVCFYFIPRDSMLVTDIWAYVEPYEKRIAKAAIKRAATLWDEFVKPGKAELLKTDKDCYQCSPFRRDVDFV